MSHNTNNTITYKCRMSFHLLSCESICNVAIFDVSQGLGGPRGDKGDRGDSGERGRDGSQVSCFSVVI